MNAKAKEDAKVRKSRHTKNEDNADKSEPFYITK